MTELLRVQGVTQRYGPARRELHALRGVSFTVNEGETLGVVGESGSGKSTLSRLLVGLESPAEGLVTLGGLPLRNLDRSGRLRVARLAQLVFQNPFASLNPRHRVGPIIREPLDIHAVGTRAQRDREVWRLTQRVGLPADALERYPHELSGGQRQRVAIARALALKPRLLVADEPVSALDVSVQAQILNLLADLQAELGLALVFVSHDLRVVRWLAHRVLVLYMGREVESGPVAEVLESPLHPYTQLLAASVPSLEMASPMAGMVSEPPSPFDLPTGCPFRPRCGAAEPGCATQEPTAEALGARRVACPPQLALATRKVEGS